MTLLARRIVFLGRYLAVLGIGGFTFYRLGWSENFTLAILGPSIFIAHWLKTGLNEYVVKSPISENVREWGLLLPVTVIYFSILGFQMKQLWNEQGFARVFSLVALIGFVVFIHFWTWQELMTYYAAPPGIAST